MKYGAGHSTQLLMHERAPNLFKSLLRKLDSDAIGATAGDLYVLETIYCSAVLLLLLMHRVLLSSGCRHLSLELLTARYRSICLARFEF